LSFKDVKTPIVITVHDFVKARFPHLEGDSTEAIAQQSLAIRHATHLICVSRATELDLLHFHPEAVGRTSVIYHGSSFPISPAPSIGPLFNRPRFLFVGRRETYKNFALVTRAFAKAQRRLKSLELHVAGPPLTDDERWQLHFLGISDRVFCSVYPDEQTLRDLYRSSLALLYPSKHEGFGIPPLEAMACGTLAVTSNNTSLPEVVGDGGILLDPDDEDAWTECILQIGQNEISREKYVAFGQQRAAILSWDESAKQHVKVYESLL
jgi:glycosyltransferase involved in cell wall biosynthesis